MIILPSKRIVQPQVSVPISPFARDLQIRSLALPGINIDACRNAPLVLEGANVVNKITVDGRCWQGAATNSSVAIRGAEGPVSDIVNPSKPWSFSTRVEVTQTGLTEVFVGDHHPPDAPGATFAIGLTAAGAFYADAYSSGWTAVTASGGSASIGMHDILVIFSGNTNVSVTLYVDGVFIQTATSSNTLWTSYNVRLMQAGGYGDSVCFSGRMYYAAFFDRDVSAYAKQLAQNPWQLFAPKKRRLITVSAAGGNITLTPSLFTRTPTFYGPTEKLALPVALFTRTPTFYGPTEKNGLTVALFTRTPTFYGPTEKLALPSALFTRPPTFYGVTVTGTDLTIYPSLFTRTPTFYGPVVTLPSTQVINLNDSAPSGLMGKAKGPKLSRKGLDQRSPVQVLAYGSGSGQVGARTNFVIEPEEEEVTEQVIEQAVIKQIVAPSVEIYKDFEQKITAPILLSKKAELEKEIELLRAEQDELDLIAILGLLL